MEALGCTEGAIILGTGLESVQEKELIEKFRAALPEWKRKVQQLLERAVRRRRLSQKDEQDRVREHPVYS